MENQELKPLVEKYKAFVAKAVFRPRPSFLAWWYFWEMSDRERDSWESASAFMAAAQAKYGKDVNRDAETASR